MDNHSITLELAAALRALFESPREGECGPGTKLLCGEDKLDDARLALAAFDKLYIRPIAITLADVGVRPSPVKSVGRYNPGEHG